MVRGVLKAAGFAAALLAAGAARAEVIEITGEFPAEYREASFLDSLSIDRIGGQDGPALGLAIERALSGGGVPFELLGGRMGRDSAEGSLNGAVSTGVEEIPFKRKEKKCVERDDKDKCVREEEVEVFCRRRVINVNADLRIVRNTDGRIVYSAAKPWRDETSWCQGGYAYRTPEEAISTGIREIAGSVRREIAPSIETYRLRLRESTKGLSKDAQKQFKALIKSSQRNMPAACQAWEAMNAAEPGVASVVFDLGLCAEQAGNYEKALALYRQAMPLIGSSGAEAREGADRAQRLIAGRADARERAKRRRR